MDNFSQFLQNIGCCAARAMAPPPRRSADTPVTLETSKFATVPTLPCSAVLRQGRAAPCGAVQRQIDRFAPAPKIKKGRFAPGFQHLFIS
jgi:hypothetical protein